MRLDWLIMELVTIIWLDSPSWSFFVALLYIFECISPPPQMNNLMWQLQMQQNQLLNGGLPAPLQMNQLPAGGSRQQDNSSHWQRSSQQYNNNGSDNSSYQSRSQRYTEEPPSSRHQQSPQGRDNYHHNDRRGGRHQDSGGSRPYDTNRGGKSGYQDGRYRRYWVALYFLEGVRGRKEMKIQTLFLLISTACTERAWVLFGQKMCVLRLFCIFWY